MPTCLFCGRDRKLIAAHIIPRGFYPSPTEEGTPRLVTNTEGTWPKKSPTGVYDEEILCAECDGYLGTFDQHALEKLLNTTAKTPLFLGHVQPHGFQYRRSGPFDGGTVRGIGGVASLDGVARLLQDREARTLQWPHPGILEEPATRRQPSQDVHGGVRPIPTAIPQSALPPNVGHAVPDHLREPLRFLSEGRSRPDATRLSFCGASERQAGHYRHSRVGDEQRTRRSTSVARAPQNRGLMSAWRKIFSA